MATFSLDQVVELCKKCNAECSRRVARFVEDVNPAPPIAKTQTDNSDRMRRDQAMEKCMAACSTVNAQCPSADVIRAVVREQEEAVSANKASGGDGQISFHEPQFQLRRCEGVVQNFVSTLFWIANAPTKFELDRKDYYEQRKSDLSGPKRNAGLGSMAGTDFASEVLANAGGATAAQVQKGPNGEDVLPGTAQLSSEQRAQLDKFRNLANAPAAGGVQSGGGGGSRKGSWFS